MMMNELIAKVEQWFYDRGLDKAEPKKQIIKIEEEVEEFKVALENGDLDAMKDAIGDSIVALMGLSLQIDSSPEECLTLAYNEIKDRKGRFIDGMWVKEADLTESKPKHEFKEGDIVRIRQWNDMEQEFGLDADGDIDCLRCFTDDMKHMCGSVFKIERIEGDGVYGHRSDWSITTNMIEPFIKRVRQRYKVLSDSSSHFEVGEIVTLEKIGRHGVSFYTNDSLRQILHDIDHPECKVEYFDEGEGL